MLQVPVNVFLEKFQLQKKRHVAMQKLFKEKVLKKWTSVWDIENNGYLDACLKKEKEMNKIAHIFLQKFSKFQSREICFKEHSRIRLATIYTSTHMHILI